MWGRSSPQEEQPMQMFPARDSGIGFSRKAEGARVSVVRWVGAGSEVSRGGDRGPPGAEVSLPAVGN